jgi:hypothetical protein
MDSALRKIETHRQFNEKRSCRRNGILLLSHMRVKLALFFSLAAAALVILVFTSSSNAAQVHLKLHEFEAEMGKPGG